jgi:hypothetical protein
MQSIYWSDPSRRRTWIVLTLAYLVAVLVAIYGAFAVNPKLADLGPCARWLVVVGGLAFTLLPTLYWWVQSWHFEEWITTPTTIASLTLAQVEFEKERFKSNREMARACWMAIIAVFTAFLITAK